VKVEGYAEDLKTADSGRLIRNPGAKRIDAFLLFEDLRAIRFRSDALAPIGRIDGAGDPTLNRIFGLMK
jgi:hypothetical protein